MTGWLFDVVHATMYDSLVRSKLTEGSNMISALNIFLVILFTVFIYLFFLQRTKQIEFIKKTQKKYKMENTQRSSITKT